MAHLRSASPQITVYYDTPKGSLRQKGYSLRVRNANDRFVQTVKPMSAGAGLFARLEAESEVSSMEPDIGNLNKVLLNAIGKRETLSPVVQSVVQRTSWLLARGGSTLEVEERNPPAEMVEEVVTGAPLHDCEKRDDGGSDDERLQHSVNRSRRSHDADEEVEDQKEAQKKEQLLGDVAGELDGPLDADT